MTFIHNFKKIFHIIGNQRGLVATSTLFGIAAIVLAVAAGTTAIVSAANSGAGKLPAPPEAPELPSAEDASKKAKDDAKKRRLQQQKFGESIKTSKAGIIGEPTTQKQTVLGG